MQRLLDRPPPPPATRRRARREQQRRYQREYRRRQREGVQRIEATPAVIELLIVSKWLEAEESEDAAAIRDALDAFAKAALKTFR